MAIRDTLRKAGTSISQWFAGLQTHFNQHKQNLRQRIGTFWLATKTSAKGQWVKLVQYCTYHYRLFDWKILSYRRRSGEFFKRHFDFIRRAAIILIAVLLGLLVDYVGAYNFTPEILSNYLVAVGAMTGGTIAIVFTISIFLLQNAADLYSSQYLEVYVHDLKEKFIYAVVILITILLLAGGLYVGGSPQITTQTGARTILFSLFLIGVVFALIDWQYKNVRQKLNPAEAITFLENEGKRYIKQIHYYAWKVAGIFQAKDPTLSNDEALASAYSQISPAFLKNLDRQLENLVEISMKLSQKQEVGTTKRGFTAVHNILTNFFESRQTSSLIIPSSVAFLAVESDSQSFLSATYERLNKAGEAFIREGKEDNAAYILGVYNALTTKAVAIQFLGNRVSDNPILEQLIGYINIYVEAGQRANNLEVVFQGARVLGDTAALAANKGLQTILFGLQKNLLDVGVYGLTAKHTIVVDRCVAAFLRIIRISFLNRTVSIAHEFDDSLKNIATLVGYLSSLMKSGYITTDFITKGSLRKGHDGLRILIHEILNFYFKLPSGSEEEKRGRVFFKNKVVDFFEELYRSLRTLSETVKCCDDMLADSVGLLLSDINYFIIQLVQESEFDDVKDELLSRLRWNLHLPAWFAHHAEKFDAGSNSFNSLIDSAAKAGLLVADKLNDKELLQSAVEALVSITNHSLERGQSKYGYDEPRILERACYLGILAMKRGWTEIVTELGLKIYEFEQKYFVKYFSDLPAGIKPNDPHVWGLPRTDQLAIELLRWRDDFVAGQLRGDMRWRDDAQKKMYELVEQSDIDRFLYEIWGWWPGDSEIEDEIKEREEKRMAARKMVAALKYRVRQLENSHPPSGQ